MKELLSDKDLMKKNKSFKEAMTKYMADKKFMGAVAVFLKYLHEKEVYLSYANDTLLEYYTDYYGHEASLPHLEHIQETKGSKQFA